MHVLHIKRRAAGLGERFFHHFRGRRAVFRLLRPARHGHLSGAQHSARVSARAEEQIHRHERRFLALGKAARSLVIERLDLAHRHVGLGAEHAVALFPGVVAVGEAVARKHAAQDVALPGGRLSVLAQQVGIDLRDDRGVLRALHASLDLERGYAPVRQLRNVTGEHQILERERVAAVVRQAARLRAQAAVARALSDDGGQVALTRIAHAQCAVDEHLGLDACLARDLLDLLARAFAAEHDAGKADVARLSCPVERVDGHLRGGVQGEIRRVRMDEPRETQILHDERVRARLIQELRVLERVVQLAVSHEDVQRDVALYVSCAAVGDGVRHFLVRKALRVAARIEGAEAHVHCARTRLHGGAHALG